jgi:formate dehydrogenase beta subunit
MQLNRRNFIKLSVPSTGLIVLGGLSFLNVGRAAASISGKRSGKGILYDASMCVGCRSCETACRRANRLPPEAKPVELSSRTWTVITSKELKTGSDTERLFLKRQCMHCAEASCVAVCPAGAATYQGEFVEIDQERCTGCGYCVEACPFEAPRREPDGGTARKCTLCVDRVAQGLETACAEVCPQKAILFGDIPDLITEGQTRVQNLVAAGRPEANLYGETESGGLGVMYVLLSPASFYDLPEKPRLAVSNVLTQWWSGIITAGVLAAVPFGLLFRRRKEIEEKQKAEIEGGAN